MMMIMITSDSEICENNVISHTKNTYVNALLMINRYVAPKRTLIEKSCMKIMECAKP